MDKYRLSHRRYPYTSPCNCSLHSLSILMLTIDPNTNLGGIFFISYGIKLFLVNLCFKCLYMQQHKWSINTQYILLNIYTLVIWVISFRLQLLGFRATMSALHGDGVNSFVEMMQFYFRMPRKASVRLTIGYEISASLETNCQSKNKTVQYKLTKGIFIWIVRI